MNYSSCVTIRLMFCVSTLRTTLVLLLFFFFFKQKTAYDMRISDWSSDVCSSDLECLGFFQQDRARRSRGRRLLGGLRHTRQRSGRSEERRCRERVCQYV